MTDHILACYSGRMIAGIPTVKIRTHQDPRPRRVPLADVIATYYPRRTA